jgi:hypothetical protein
MLARVQVFKMYRNWNFLIQSYEDCVSVVA